MQANRRWTSRENIFSSESLNSDFVPNMEQLNLDKH